MIGVRTLDSFFVFVFLIAFMWLRLILKLRPISGWFSNNQYGLMHRLDIGIQKWLTQNFGRRKMTEKWQVATVARLRMFLFVSRFWGAVFFSSWKKILATTQECFQEDDDDDYFFVFFFLFSQAPNCSEHGTRRRRKEIYLKTIHLLGFGVVQKMARVRWAMQRSTCHLLLESLVSCAKSLGPHFGRTNRRLHDQEDLSSKLGYICDDIMISPVNADESCRFLCLPWYKLMTTWWLWLPGASLPSKISPDSWKQTHQILRWKSLSWGGYILCRYSRDWYGCFQK